MASHPRGISVPSSFITMYNSESKAVFTEDASAAYAKFKTVPGTEAVFADIHISPSITANLNHSAANNDLKATEDFVASNESMTSLIPAGVGFRRTDMPPGSAYPMHRTLSVDYGTVVAGEVELVLDSGEKRTLKQGDTV